MRYSFGANWRGTSRKAGRWPRAKRAGIKGSPCSPPFGLGNDMGVPLGIMPYKLGLLAVEHTDEGYASVGRGELEEFLEHAVA